MAPKDSSFKVYIRWRPLRAAESSTPSIQLSTTPTPSQNTQNAITISSQSASGRPQTWKSGPSFTHIFPSTAINHDIYAAVVAPTLPKVLQGATCNFFAYGHSGSGKTHTIIGYEYEDEQQLGMCLAAAHNLFRALNTVCTSDVKENLTGEEQEQTNSGEELGVAVRLYEVRGKSAFDLLNNGTECHVREGSDGRTHVRGQTEVLEGGKVRVRPIAAVPCWSFEQLRGTVLGGLAKRTTGSSSVHDESSRTHAVLELEVVNRALMDARDAVIERESELVPVGKRATDVYLEEQMASLVRTEDGGWTQNPDRPLDQARIDEAEAEKKEYEARVVAAESAVSDCFKNSPHPCLGGKFVFVDLAGSEYFNQGGSTPVVRPKQTPQEQRQGRQINTDLFALKEVIRAKALNQGRIPFRSSPLTMILRSHFEATGEGESAMILTASPSESQFSATINTLKYGNLVGEAGARS